jgi:Ca2+-binding EF-hand superfamily protein
VLQLAKIDITDEDRREAERSFRYCDQNGDGKIDSAEMSRSRYGADLPMYDQNRDGAITITEMESRYASSISIGTGWSRRRSA